MIGGAYTVTGAFDITFVAYDSCGARLELVAERGPHSVLPVATPLQLGVDRKPYATMDVKLPP